MPKVSVVIPNYNRAHYLKEALISVMAQAYKNWEAIVVDDGSTDESLTLVKSLADKDSRIRWIQRDAKPKGAAMCRNIGIDRANGDYIIFLDSDDLLAPHCLQQRVDFMEAHPDLEFSVYKMQFFNNIIGDNLQVWNLETEDAILTRFLRLDSVWQTTGPIWNKTALTTLGGFNTQLVCWQDIDIHLKALFANLNFQMCYDLPVDCYYRKDSSDSISQSNTNSLVKLESKQSLYRWTLLETEALKIDNSSMALHILASAIQGYQFLFFWRFYNEVKDSLSAFRKRRILKMAFIKQFRLSKFSYFRSCYFQLTSDIILENSIGKFDVSSSHKRIQSKKLIQG